ncbi:MAG: nucleoside deaminase [Bacteroidia bacterium]|nr:nucleoside deaminase [Bacteroidia bacterium]NNM16688.1 nucleoside deaminase [Bacteroidia bacterium]
MPLEPFTDTHFMKIALQEAEKAFDADEVPVGAIVVCENQVIAKAHNQTELLHDVTAHAEIIAITSASNFLDSKYLNECTLYVTLEPCVMCAGALMWTQIQNIVYGAFDEKKGFTQIGNKILHPSTNCTGGILENECSIILKEYFKSKRK